MASAPRAPQVPAELLEKFDKNHDGRLDDDERAELQKFLQERRGPMGQSPAAMREFLLRQFDHNADGKIDAAEMAELEKTMRPRMESNPMQLERYDKNGDGKLDETEWAAAREQLERMLNEPPPSAQFGQAKLDAVKAEVAKRKAGREKRAPEATMPKP